MARGAFWKMRHIPTGSSARAAPMIAEITGSGYRAGAAAKLYRDTIYFREGRGARAIRRPRKASGVALAEIGACRPGDTTRDINPLSIQS
jgi:hypothetical protein